MIALIAKLLNREQKYRFTVTNRTTTECTVMSLTITQANEYRDRGYWVE